MGRVSRHAGFPFADTETLTGPDLEHDIGGLINEVNGRLDDTNVDASAGITAAQLKQLTITDREIEPNTITTAQMAAASVGDSDFNEDNTLRALTTDTSTYQTFTGLAALSVTPGSTSALSDSRLYERQDSHRLSVLSLASYSFGRVHVQLPVRH
jgi:hypothetical protein